MGKKLLFLFLLTIAYLFPTSGQAQECPSSVSISSDAGNTICEGTNVTFTPTPTGGSGLTYEWFIENVSRGTGSSFSTTTLTNNDKIKVVAKSTNNTSCATTSNILTMTVNTVRVPSVSISASATTICPGEPIQFTAAPTNGGTSPEYVWKIGTTPQSETSSVFSTSSLADGQSVTVQLTSNATCASPTTAISNSIPITVQAGTPAMPNTISGTAVLCPGVAQTYTIAAVPNATSYSWTLPNGWSGTSTTNSINVTSGATGTGIITVKAINNCGTSEGRDLPVTVKTGTPTTPGTITGETQVCPGVSQIYSIASVTGASSYEWILPSGWAGTSSTNSISVTTGATGSGTISVKAKNDCGTSAAKTINITVKAGTPAVPSTITGTAAVCPGVSQTYSITAVTGATSYIWTLPNSGWTGTSTTNSITVTSGTAGGNITVKATNDCGTGPERILALTVKPGTPATPGDFITTSLQSPTSICPNTSATYAVPTVTGATQYIWTIPSGFSASPLTTTTPSITITAGSSGSGNITVKATNDCGTSVARIMAITIGKPAPVMSGSITGSARVCSTATNLVYSIPTITNAIEYLWTLPNGWTGTSTTNSITVSASSSEGNISVIAKNSCGQSIATSLTVKVNNTVPAQPGAITSNLTNTSTAICPPASGITFEVPETSGMSYTWTVPAGFVITSGQGTNKIIVNITATTSYSSNAKVDVVATNSCGPSLARSFSNISIDKFVVTNLGDDQTICSSTSTLNLNGFISFGTGNTKLRIASLTTTGTNQVQGLPNPNTSVNDFTYQYTPSTQDLAAGKVTFTLTTEKPAGACAAGTDEMTVFFKPDPIASISGTTSICTGNSTDIIFNATPNTVVTYKKNSGTDQTIAIGASGTATLNTGALTANTTYSLLSVKYSTAPDCPKAITGSAVVTITAKPTVTISYGSSPYNKCINTGQTVTLTGTGAYTNGVYSALSGLSIDPSTGAIIPSTSTAGTYTVTYETLASGGCEKVSTTTQVVIEAIPTITLSYEGTPFCSDNNTSPLPTLGGTGKYQGGSYSADKSGLSINVTSGAINIALSTPGSYNVTYSVTPASGCTPVTQLTPVVITEKPQPSISYSATQFCRSLNNVQPVNLTQSGTAVITGGIYSSLPSGLKIDATSGAINPNLSAAGDYIIKYTLAATKGCEAVFTETNVSITEIPSVEISYAGPFCQSTSSSESVTFTNPVGAYQNGIFSATGGLTINASTGEITPNQSGTHTVYYKIPASAGCSEVIISTDVIITPEPSATITYNGPFCSSETNPQAVSYSNTAGAYQNGEFSGTNGLSIAADGSINPSTSTTGIHTVTYKIPSANGCEDVVSTTDIEIFEQVAITTQPSNLGICSTEAASFEVVASGDNISYEWKRTDGAAITNATGENTSQLSFSNATSTNAGEYYVEVSGNAACSSIATSETVTLNIDENIIIIEPDTDEVFCYQDKDNITFEFIAHANGAPLEFTWLKDGVDLNLIQGKYEASVSIPVSPDVNYTGSLNIIDPNPDDNGVYAVRIKGPDYFTCSDAISKTYTLNVSPLPPNPTTAGEVFYCQEETAVALAATGESGASFKWYGSEDGDDLITDLIPNTDISGTTSYWVSQTTTTCESNRTELKITVKEKPAVPTTTQILSFCLNEVATQLEAVGNSGNTINWYDTEDSTSPLAEAPKPVTSADITTSYWVSQTKDGCESDRVQITITVNPLPILTAEAAEATICSGSSTTLNATGATTYLWTIDGTAIEPAAESTKASPTVNPTTTTTYLVTGTSEEGCTSTAEVTVNVDEPTVPGTLTGPESVCASSPNGTLTLSGYTGEIQRWERSNDAGANWTEIATNTTTLDFNGLSGTTSFRAVVKNGVCSELTSNELEITIDPIPVGGELAFGEFGRIFVTCESPNSSTLVDLALSGNTGQISLWEYKPASQPSWQTVTEGSGDYVENSLTAAKIESLNLQETTAFRVKIISGVCEAFAYSQTGILSIISSNIEPTPVTVSKNVICVDETVTLSASTGYEAGQEIGESGNFDNASITNSGWRVRKNGVDQGFSTSASNIRPDIWLRVTPREFITANINTNTTNLQLFDPGIDDGNKGFAIVSGNNPSTLETPVFSITDMDQAILKFDQAYNLTAGASISVEISTNGGASYETVLLSVTGPATSGNYTSFATGSPQSRPLNKMEIDLGDYLGMGNLRIRFNFVGKRDGDLWTLDGITIPDGPANIGTVWKDYSLDPENPTVIGTNPSEAWTPSLIGWNSSVIITTLEYSNGSCETAVNSEEIKVFVFDSYSSSPVATSEPCESNSATINAVVQGAKQGNITSFPTDDNYFGEWEATGPDGYIMDESHFSPSISSPDATFKPVDANDQPIIGNFTLKWVMTNQALDDNGNPIPVLEACPYTPGELKVFIGCPRLDFDGVDDFVDLGEGYTGDYSIEAWIRPETATGTIISGPEFEITMGDLPNTVAPNTRWYHIAASNGRLYVDGIDIKAFTLRNGSERAFIGAKWAAPNATNFFSGWIEEVRIWNGNISQDQIKFLMNQRLQTGANIGVEIPMPAPGLGYDKLAGYYQLIADPTKILNGGYTEDLSLSTVNGKLRNMTTLQENTAPLPYTSNADLVWSDRNTWTQPVVWDFPNSVGIGKDANDSDPNHGITYKTPIDWNIVRTSHNITSGGKDITVLGLKAEVIDKKLTIESPGFTGLPENNPGQMIRVTHYLKLDGNIDLVGESQLIQDQGSILEETSKGWLERDQQGTLSSFNYNYWTAPVSTQGSSNNSGFTIGDIMWDGTDSNDPQIINYLPGPAAADGAKANPIIKSNYWLFKFANKLADDYDSWQHIGSAGYLKTGEGHTMKGVAGTGGTANIIKTQNYVYRGKPNNGDITLTIDKERNYLIGNPYPSAIDAVEFILDNLDKDIVGGARGNKNVFDGTLYFWDHFSGATHILREYVGGYAVMNLFGTGVPAISTDDRILANNEKGTKTPEQFIPVSQGFFVNSQTYETLSSGQTFSLDGGPITFKNSQRVFSRETSGNSIFLKPEIVTKNTKEEASSKIPLIRISFKSPKGYHRQLLVGAHPATTNGFDLGYDAPMIEYNVEDMYWIQGNNYLVIQGVPDFGKEQILPLGIRIEKAGEFTIKIDSLINMNIGQNVYLKDKALDTIHDIKKTPYLSTAEPGEITDRFELIFYKEVKEDPAVSDPVVDVPVEDPVIIDELSEIGLLHSYTENEMMVLNPKEIQISVIYLFDLNGKLLSVFNDIPTEKQIRLKVNNFSDGIYVLKMHTEDRIITRKIVIKK